MPTDAPPQTAPAPEVRTGILARHGTAMARHARPVALVALLLSVAGYLVAALGIGGPSLFSRLEVGEPTVAGEALEGRALLRDNDPSGPAVQGLWDRVDPAAPAVAAELADAQGDLLAIPGIARVLDPTVIGPAAIATDGRGILVTVQLAPDLARAEQDRATDAALARLAQLPDAVDGSTVDLTGERILRDTITGQVEKDLKKGEGISLPFSLLIMVLIFGGFAAAGIPLAGAIAAIAGGLVSLLLFTYVVDLDATVVNVVTVLGLGLCIDYSLLMVSRYREQMHDLWDLSGGHGDVPREVREHAMAATMATAGRTVIFSGVTVAIAVSGLLLIDMPIIRSVGAGAVSVVVIAVVVATSVVPALLVLATRHVAGQGSLVRMPGFRRIAGAFDHSPRDDGWFSRWASRIQRRPWLAFLGVAAALVVLSLPAWRINLVSSGVELLPPDNPERELYVQILDRFPATAQPEVTVVARADAGGDPAGDPAAALTALGARIAELPGVARVGEVARSGEVLQLGVFAVDPEGADEVVREIRDLRDAGAGPGGAGGAEGASAGQTWVTGGAAILVDFDAQLRRDVPLALALVVLATLALLFLLTGSVLVPIKALLMNLLSLGATFGVLVLVFQDGNLEGLLDFSATGGIEAVLPVIIFAFAFGLSMDYEVFLLARIKEFRDAGLGNDDAVRMGLQRTGRIITSAAMLIVVVFSGFILGDLLAIKQTGVALSVAVLIDATAVRIILVPATMTLLGEWNWWAPAPLRRLHDRVGLAH